MAEGLLRYLAGDRFVVESAGTVASFVRPQAIAAMKEIGIDISGQRSKSLEEFSEQPFDYVITVCDNANQTCPIFPGKATRIHWSFPDPVLAVGSEEQVMNAFRLVRDEIKAKLTSFVAEDAKATFNA
jgi:arsenate reductase